MGADDHTNKAGNAVSRGADSVGDAVDDAKDSRTVRVVARAGFVALGLIHLLIGVIALRIALGESGQADKSGAVAQVAATPGGVVLLWAGLVACGVLALYMASDAVMGWSRGVGSKRWMKRLKAAGQAIVFAAAAVTFGSFALSRPSSSSDKSRTASADLMSSTPGTVLLVIIGVALLAAAGTYIFLGITRRYEKNLRGKPSGALGDAFTVLGVAGYCAKGVALGAQGLPKTTLWRMGAGVRQPRTHGLRYLLLVPFPLPAALTAGRAGWHAAAGRNARRRRPPGENRRRAFI